MYVQLSQGAHSLEILSTVHCNFLVLEPQSKVHNQNLIQTCMHVTELQGEG